MKCLSCQFENKDSEKFCIECGNSMAGACRRCFQMNPSSAKFCGACGFKLGGASLVTSGRPNELPKPVGRLSGSLTISSEGERRRATILRADLTGYTALTEHLDAETIEEILERIKVIAEDVVAYRGGIINQFRGDEVIALFGAALSENDARDAVQAALDLHERVKSLGDQLRGTTGTGLTMHSGICTGLVVIRPSSNRDGAFSISGDAINTAARLADLAAADELLVAPSTQLLIQPFFRMDPLAPLELKGKSVELTPHRVLSAYTSRSQFDGRIMQGVASFVGRAFELSQLNNCLARAKSQHGQIVVISADAGIGKSRLVYEFIKTVQQSFTTVLTTCSPVDVDTPYFPWTDIARQLLNIDLSTDVDIRVANIIEACKTLELDADRDVPVLCQLLAPAQSSVVPQITEQGPARRQAIFQALFALIRRAANVRPLVIVFEDWHWTDRASDDFFRHYIGQFASLPLLILVTLRATAQVTWPIQGHLTALTIEPLPKQATGEIIASMLGISAAPEQFASMLHERTGGNPLFIEEVVRSLRADGLIGVSDGELSIAKPITALGIPETVQRAVLQRLDRLQPVWRETLRRASVIGREFSLSILGRLVATGTDLDGAILELQALDFLTQVQEGPQSVFAFKHVVIQTVAYETLLIKQRKELHGLVAKAIEESAGELIDENCEALAYHYSRDHDLDRAVRYLEQAGDQASGNFALESARNHYVAAIHLLTNFEQTIENRRLRIEISLKWASASQFAVSIEQVDVMRISLADAIALGDLRLKSLCHYWLGRMYYGLGDPSSGIPEFEAVLAGATHLNDQWLLGRTYCVLGRSALFTAEPARGIEFLKLGIPLLERLGDYSEVTYSISSHACIRTFIGEFAKADELFAQARDLAVGKQDRTNEALVLQQLSYSRCLRGNWESAIEAAAACLDIAQVSGMPVLAAFAQIFGAYASWMAGGQAQGYRNMLQAIQAYRDTGYRMAGSLCHGWCAEICVLNGDLDRARVHAQLSIAQEARGDRFGQLPAQRTLVAIAIQTGNHSEARFLVGGLIDAAERRGARPDLGIGHYQAAEFFLKMGEIDTATFHTHKARQIFETLDMPWWSMRTNH